MRSRCLPTARSVEAREKLAPIGRVMCKRGEDLAWRSAHGNGGMKTDGGRVEEVKIDGFAGEHPESPCCVTEDNMRFIAATHSGLIDADTY
jgi:hypothetical protein